VLLHMAERDEPATSESLAAAMKTNPVVLRRLMTGLRHAGFVASEKGHGGGWVISCPMATTTLRDIHEALGAPTLLAVGHRDDHPTCLVEQAVNAALGDVYQQAEALLLAQLGRVTLAQLSKDFHRCMVAGGFSHTVNEHAV
jgi:DNA-binding IscR family transcriptional regulator